ncbi:HD domain-containing protein [candidate division WOR-3 bacterium]|nr:HD domain-containing protein [candidate division WOR-3 bacterium]
MRDRILNLLEEKYKHNKNLLKHMLAVEACMEGLAKYFGEDPDKWALAGLLHDYDYLETKDDLKTHGKLTVKEFEGKIDKEILHAIEAHPGNLPRESLMDKALYSCDPLTGLIVAAVLMHPTKKISNVDTKFVLRRFKEKRFAAGANRDQIKECENMGLSLEKFTEICLNSMKGIAGDLGL